MRFGNAVVAGLIGLFAATPLAQASLVELLIDGSSGTINSAWFIENDIQATGSGVLDSFVRVSSNEDTLQGFNTSARKLKLDENSSPTFTHDLLLTDVPILTLNNIAYREFILDINQAGHEPLLSLDEVQIYLGDQFSDGGVPNSAAALAAATNLLVWDMDGLEDSWVKLNYNLNTGSGSGDMRLLVPNSLFDSTQGDYVYLYSQFGLQGGHLINNDGYEEWAVRGQPGGQCGEENNPPCPPPPDIPEPTSMLLIGTGLIGAIGFGYARKKRLL